MSGKRRQFGFCTWGAGALLAAACIMPVGTQDSSSQALVF